ncbi:hypothetical protein AB1Y20_010343 [Prymnesium parvum]|uniref:Uncharacterized protein n=1 Tax=Prymnesium parvum TaxID=97485 RepID=A0AB34K3D4_PRYPA
MLERLPHDQLVATLRRWHREPDATVDRHDFWKAVTTIDPDATDEEVHLAFSRLAEGDRLPLAELPRLLAPLRLQQAAHSLLQQDAAELAPAPSADPLELSVGGVAARLRGALARLEASLAQLPPAAAPLSAESKPLAGGDEESVAVALDLVTAGVPAKPVMLNTRMVHEHMRRLYNRFATAPAPSPGRPRGSASPPRSPRDGRRMSVFGFRQLLRSAGLLGSALSVGGADAVFTQVVKSRSGRMSGADLLLGLAVVARKLYPDAPTPSDAFYSLVAERLLPWLLQVEQAERASRSSGEPRNAP